jgi:hypothetical protein
VRKRIAALTRKYEKARIAPLATRDRLEKEVLLDFASAILADMGLKSEGIAATKMLHTLESAGLGLK